VKPPPGPPAARQQPRTPGRLRAVALAIGVHLAFFSLIYFGVSWQSTPVAPVEAELWDKLPPVKAAQAPKAQAEPAKPPEPKPQPKPEPPPPKPRPPEPRPAEPKPQVKPEPPRPDPAIALKAEREKKEKEKEKRERLEKDKRERVEKEKLERVEKEKLEKKKEEEAKKKLAQEEAAKKKREDEQRRKAEELARAEAEKAAAAAAAVKKSEFDKFVNDIRAKIRGRANVPDTVTGSPEVEVQIRILPGGEVLDIAIVKRSGNPTYDTAIERAIRSASPLPVPPANSELFPQFRELNLKIRHER
jgi:colicin import membrane protein